MGPAAYQNTGVFQIVVNKIPQNFTNCLQCLCKSFSNLKDSLWTSLEIAAIKRFTHLQLTFNNKPIQISVRLRYQSPSQLVIFWTYSAFSLNLVPVQAIFLNWKRSVCHSLSDQGPLHIHVWTWPVDLRHSIIGNSWIAFSQNIFVNDKWGRSSCAAYGKHSSTKDEGVTVSLVAHMTIIFGTFDTKYKG